MALNISDRIKQLNDELAPLQERIAAQVSNPDRDESLLGQLRIERERLDDRLDRFAREAQEHVHVQDLSLRASPSSAREEEQHDGSDHAEDAEDSIGQIQYPDEQNDRTGFARPLAPARARATAEEQEQEPKKNKLKQVQNLAFAF
jgi:hypothetical protein